MWQTGQGAMSYQLFRLVLIWYGRETVKMVVQLVVKTKIQDDLKIRKDKR